MSQDPRTLISPSFEATKLENPSTDDLLDIFEDRVTRCVLEPARLLASRGTGIQIASLALVLPYFEALTSWREGKSSSGQSQAFFVNGFSEVFPSQEHSERIREAGKLLYVEGRCGMLHELLSRSLLFFVDSGHPLEFSPGSAKPGSDRYMLICPSAFVAHICQHFAGLMQILREPANSGARERISRRVLADSEGEAVILLAPDREK